MRPRFQFALDANAASEPGEARPDLGMMAWLREHQHETAIPVIVAYELRKGIEALPFDCRPRRQLEQRWRDFVRDFAEAVLAFDLADAWAAAEHYQILRAEFGSDCVQAVGWADFLIAAQARAHQLTVVTRNARHFPHCSTINPWLEDPAT